MLSRKTDVLNVLSGIGWLAVFFLWGELFSRLFPDWNSIEVSVYANMVNIAFCLPVVLCLTWRRTSIGFVAPAVMSILGRCVFVIACWFCASILGNIVALTNMDANLEAYLTSQIEDIRLFAFLSIVAAPVAEELLFRGILYQYFRPVMGVAAGAVVSSLVFGASHGTVPHVLIGLFFGTAQCFLFEYSGQIWWNILVHSLVNVLSFLASVYALDIGLFISAPIILFLAICAGLFALVLYPGEPARMQS